MQKSNKKSRAIVSVYFEISSCSEMGSHKNGNIKCSICQKWKEIDVVKWKKIPAFESAISANSCHCVYFIDKNGLFVCITSKKTVLFGAWNRCAWDFDELTNGSIEPTPRLLSNCAKHQNNKFSGICICLPKIGMSCEWMEASISRIKWRA